MTDSYEIVVIGAGPAGCSAAATLAKAGRNVALIDRDAFPRDKLCGEFLSGESRAYLDRLGCSAEIYAEKPAQMHSMKFIGTTGYTLAVKLPSPAFGLSRKKLDYTLISHAARCGAKVFQGAEVRSIEGNNPGGPEVTLRLASKGADVNLPGEIKAKFVVAAYGRHSHMDRKDQHPSRGRQSPYVGLKLHHRVRSGSIDTTVSTAGEMYAFRGGYCGISPVENNSMNVCMLLHRDLIKSAGGTSWPQILSFLTTHNPAFARRMLQLEAMDEPVQAVAKVSFSLKNLSSGRVFYVGDAAGMIAPMCGDGQAMALESGQMLAESFIAASSNGKCGPDINLLARNWSTAWNHRFKKRILLGRALQNCLMRPGVSNAILHTLTFLPESATNYLAKATRG